LRQNQVSEKKLDYQPCQGEICMKEIKLDEAWKMRAVTDTEWINATVPGSVYADLLSAKKIEDPFWRDNEVSAMNLMNNDFIYRKEFDLEEDFLREDELYLCCKGLDTVADIYLNGILIGHAENMHRTWEYDIKKAARAGTNLIEIILHSPLAYIKKAYENNPADGSEECTTGFPTLRKAHCQFGWDWGPRLPDAGIWRDISVISFSHARIKTVEIRQFHENGNVRLEFTPVIEKTDSEADPNCDITVISPDGEVFKADKNGRLVISCPKLWWPNGLGDHPLYCVDAELFCNGFPIDRWSRKIGLRTMEMHIEKDKFGESFSHSINGKDIFAMGADYIPEDSIFGRRSAERTRVLLTDCAAANFNVIRVWGGGCYPDDWFYDICDELGLMVWQDFMFACAVYNLTPEFEQNIISELKDNIIRIRHHACIALFCGNNEMETFVDQNKWVRTPGQKADYIKMYEYLFPKLAKELSPQIFYWPSSPSSGGSFDEPNSPDRGDTHFWEVWHGNKPFSEYQNHYFRYLSEFGFESFPCKKTIDSFAPKEEQNIFSYVMEKHQKKPGANGKIVTYLSQTYLYPHKPEMLIFASQLLQAEAVAYGVEHLRRNRGRCMGAVYWQVNDCWPVASWSSIDYFGRWKALHYFAKRFFTPVLLSAEVTSALTRNPDINQETVTDTKAARISVSNETFHPFKGEIKWEICGPNGIAEKSGSISVNAEPLSSVWEGSVDATEYSAFEYYLHFMLMDGNCRVVSERSELFCPPKYYHFLDPNLRVSIKEDKILITASAFAHSVCISSPDSELLLEDNFFDMQPGTRSIKIIRGNPQSLNVCSVYDIR
jgi:beta-mannosidase